MPPLLGPEGPPSGQPLGPGENELDRKQHVLSDRLGQIARVRHFASTLEFMQQDESAFNKEIVLVSNELGLDIPRSIWDSLEKTDPDFVRRHKREKPDQPEPGGK